MQIRNEIQFLSLIFKKVHVYYSESLAEKIHKRGKMHFWKLGINPISFFSSAKFLFYYSELWNRFKDRK